MTTCNNCSQIFQITDWEQQFHRRIAPHFGGKEYPVPPPTLCPLCRWQRRLSYRNERTFHRRTCDLTGKSMISMHPTGTTFPVYYIKDWLGDKWDPLQYGRDYNFARSFFEQFEELRSIVPHFNLFVDPDRDENSEYTNCSDGAKNCYLISQSSRNEDCYYSRGINSCKNCCDCLRVEFCELCYDCISMTNCYHCLYCQDCDNSSDCYFSTNLRGCKYCFSCHNLIQKEYYFLNEPLTKEEWQRRVKAISLTNTNVAQWRATSEKLRLTTPHRFARIIKCEDSTGDHIMNCRDAHEVYDSYGLEHCMFCFELQTSAKYCMDYSMWGETSELMYECCGCGTSSYHCLFCNQSWQSATSLLYCDSCFPATKNCFGCFGVRHGQYCILNKQYSKEQYDKLVPRIIEQMMQLGEWGEFFPIAKSPHGYNETIAQEYFPLSKEEVLARGWRWRDEDKAVSAPQERNLVPDVIGRYDDGYLNRLYHCEVTGRPFKFIQQELRFYEQLGLALPKLHHDVRHKQRIAKRNKRALHARHCEQCGEKIASTYSVEQPEIVFCEQCYLRTVS